MATWVRRESFTRLLSAQSQPITSGVSPRGQSFQRVASSEADKNRVGYEYYGSTSGTLIMWPGTPATGLSCTSSNRRTLAMEWSSEPGP